MLYPQIEKAMEARNAEAWTDLLHDDFEFVRHQSGSSMDKSQVLEMMRNFMASEAASHKARDSGDVAQNVIFGCTTDLDDTNR